jgi:hypothetical protein
LEDISDLEGEVRRLEDAQRATNARLTRLERDVVDDVLAEIESNEFLNISNEW